MLRMGTLTLPQAIARQGWNPDAVLAEIAATNVKLDALGLKLDGDPRAMTKAGAFQPVPAEDEPGGATDEPSKA